MKKNNSLTYLISAISLILIGIYIGYKLYWTEKIYGTLTNGSSDVFVFFLFGISALFLSVFISKAKNYPVNIFTKIDKKKRLKIIEKIGNEQYNSFEKKNALTFAFIFLFLFIIIYIKGFSTFENYQLKKNGKRIDVKIIEIRNGPKGNKVAHFEFKHNESNIKKELYLKDYQKEGEYYPIVYSLNDPRIIRWVEKN